MRSNDPPQGISAGHWQDDLAAAVRQRRRALSLTQAELARLSGCGTAFLYALENGKRSLRLDKLVDVLVVLGLQLKVEAGKQGLAIEEQLR